MRFKITELMGRVANPQHILGTCHIDQEWQVFPSIHNIAYQHFVTHDISHVWH